MHSGEHTASDIERGTITIENVRPGVRVVGLRGSHDMVTAHELEEVLKDALRSGDGVVLDLSETTFLDSTVLHALVAAARLGQLAKREVVLQFGTFEPIRRIFEITRLLELFDCASTREQALALARADGQPGE
jgi:anti-anti-sigma factor